MSVVHEEAVAAEVDPRAEVVVEVVEVVVAEPARRVQREEHPHPFQRNIR